MPTFRSITTSLVSQHDICEVPEFTPPAVLNDPFSTPPPPIDTDRALVSVYIPIYPTSQFWLSYEISPPNPPKLLYYFKLYINGRSIVSWGCGADNDFQGRTMFGIFERIQIERNVRKSYFERRVLCFGTEDESVQNEVPDSLSGLMEIKVFRSSGRKRIEPEIQDYQSSLGVQRNDKKAAKRRADDGISLVNGGVLSIKDPRRYYKYALLDPLDHPFATFHYHYRSWDHLVDLGVISPSPSTANSSIRSLTPQQRPNSPESSELELASLASLSHSLENTIAELPNSAGTRPITIDRNESNDSNNSTGTVTKHHSPGTSTPSLNSTDSTTGSPLIIPRPNPLRMHRPPTPPPRSSPTKTLAQLPPAIPETIPTSSLHFSLNTLNTLHRRASFTSLIRTHLPDPDPDPSTFQLKPPSLNLNPPKVSTTRPARSASVGALMEVVNMAKKRRESRESEVGSEGSSSVVVSSPGSGENAEEMMKWSEKKMEKEERRREREEQKKEKRKREQSRKLHLWEEI